MQLIDLIPEATYYLVVKSTDLSDNTAQSEENSFITEKARGCFINTAADNSENDTEQKP